jgi:hypothetical protein
MEPQPQTPPAAGPPAALGAAPPCNPRRDPLPLAGVCLLAARQPAAGRCELPAQAVLASPRRRGAPLAAAGAATARALHTRDSLNAPAAPRALARLPSSPALRPSGGWPVAPPGPPPAHPAPQGWPRAPGRPPDPACLGSFSRGLGTREVQCRVWSGAGVRIDAHVLTLSRQALKFISGGDPGAGGPAAAAAGCAAARPACGGGGGRPGPAGTEVCSAGAGARRWCRRRRGGQPLHRGR